MFDFFGRLANENLHVTDLQFCTPDGFRKFADTLCSRAGSGWQRVTLPVRVEGYPEIQVAPLATRAGARHTHPTRLPRQRLRRTPTAAPHPPRAAPATQLEPVELVYRDVVKMLKGFIAKFAGLREFAWRWSFTPEACTSDGEPVIEHPASAAWWCEQAHTVEELFGWLLGLQIYSDETTLNNKRSRSAYPLYVVPMNGSFDLYRLLFPASVVAYMPVMTTSNAGAHTAPVCRHHPPAGPVAPPRQRHTTPPPTGAAARWRRAPQC
jgi:hypothetical protein